MAQDTEVASSVPVIAQPSSPTGSTSSKEGTRDTREKLKKTSIATLATSKDVEVVKSHSDQILDTTNGSRGRPSKKRSFEDLAKGEADQENEIVQPPLPKSGHHKRMRSRDINSADHSAYAIIDNEITQPVQEETDLDAQISPGGPAVLIDLPSQEEMDADAAKSKVKPAEKEPQSGFANTSSASPFGITETQTTSHSAFASSGLSAFASSDKSPFGAASSKSPIGSSGGFGSTKSGFGNTGGFGSTSTFGGGSSTFGAPKPFGTTSTFGAPKPFTSTFGSGPSTFGTGKPFGTSKDDEEENEHEGNEEDPIKDEDGEQDPRFHEQPSKFHFELLGSD